MKKPEWIFAASAAIVLSILCPISALCPSLAAADKAVLPEGAAVSDLQNRIEKGYEAHRDVQDCADFALTPDQVLIFIYNAEQIGEPEEHYRFDWAPCIVTARLTWDRQRAQIVIHASLVGSILFEDGSQVRLGCDGRCEDLVFRAQPHQKSH